MTNYTLKRSKRKTIAIYVRDGEVEVRAPLNAPLREIERFVASKSKCLAYKLLESNERLSRRGGFSLDYGSEILCRGALCPIEARDGTRAGFDGERFYMPPGLPPERLKAVCIDVYRLLAKRCLTAKAYEYAAQMSLKPASVKINGAKTRWGSCSAKKNVNFSWRLIMASDDLIDYVVAHELAHLKEMNHSPRFWSVVESVIPDYRERKKRLKEFHKRIEDEGWLNINRG
jgi:predicted metal-dependent hydrolase